MNDFQTKKNQQQSTTTNTMQHDEDHHHEYLKKLVDLVPHLKDASLLPTSPNLGIITEDTNASLLHKLEGFKYLNIHSTEGLKSDGSMALNELQILQSALDYIVDLQEKIYFLNSNNDQDS
jgi:hypothetical protein